MLSFAPLAIGTIMAVGSALWWPLVVMRGDPWLRAKVAAHFGVVIETGLRGHWRIVGGGLRGFLISLLQLVGMLTAVLVWAGGMGAGLLLMYVITT